MTELYFAGQDRLDRGRTAANVDQIGIQAMFAKETFFVREPECADAG